MLKLILVMNNETLSNNKVENNINTKDTNIHKGHRSRLRHLFNNSSLTSLHEHQILELMLTFVLPQKDVNPLAHKLLDEFGSIANLLEAHPEQIKKISGVGEVVATFLHFCSKIPEIIKNSKKKLSKRLNTAQDMIDYLSSCIDFSSSGEKFYYVCLNSKGDVLHFSSMGVGSVSQIYVNNRELIQQILKFPTQIVIICHTHPYGTPVPSDEDIKFTKMFCELLDSIQIRLCDHIILSPDGYYSFFQQKLLGYESEKDVFNNLSMNILHNKLFTYSIGNINYKKK